MIKCLKSLLTVSLLTRIYCAHINSHLQYGLVTLGSMLNTEQITRLNRAQSVAISHVMYFSSGSVSQYGIDYLSIN